MAPLEVKTVFCAHPDVAAGLAAGMSDAQIGEAIHLLVVPRIASSLTAADLLTWAKGRMDCYKLPDAIDFFDTALTLGGTGKADRAALRRDTVDGTVG